MRLPVLALLVCSVAARAGAQAGPTETLLPPDDELGAVLADPATSGDDAYVLGARLFEAGRYEAAERAWLRAHSLGRNPTLLVAIADTRERRGDEPGAVAMLEQYLVERPDAPDRASVEARIATLRKSPAILLVRSEEPGHAILLDGAPVDQKTPARIEVEPGLHTVLVVGDGARVGEQTIRVAYGQVEELAFTRETKSDAIVTQSEEAKRQSELARARQDRIIRRASITTGSIALGALATGTVLGALALVRQRDHEHATSERTAARAERFATAAELTLGLAVLSGVTSLTLALTHAKKKRREREAARLKIDVGAGVATATLRF